MAIKIGGFLQARDDVDLFVVLNPDDSGEDVGGALSLSKRARNWDVSTYQPKGLRKVEQIEPLKAFDPDLILSCSYARIIPQEVIDLGREGCLNIHFADLPKNRGCLPVVWTLALQEPDLVATLHEITPGIDDGPIVLKKRTPLKPGTTAEEATETCASLGTELFKAYFHSWISGNPPDAVPQDESAVTYHKMVHPYDRYPPVWSGAAKTAAVINALTFAPHPAARVTLKNTGTELVLRGPARVEACVVTDRPLGTIEAASPDRLYLHCKDGVVSFAALETEDGNVHEFDTLLSTLVTPSLEYAP